MSLRQLGIYHRTRYVRRCAFLLLVAKVPFGIQAFSRTTAMPTTSPREEERRAAYVRARETRIARGHDPVSQAAYLELLQMYPDDATTASHLAASVCCTPLSPTKNLNCDDFAQFQRHLQLANFTTQHVGQALKINNRLMYASSPLYITPAAAGTLTIQQVETMTQTPVECLAALFLLGATVPFTTLVQTLGKDFCHLALHTLSLLQPSDVDPSRWMATVQIFPVQSLTQNMYFITDWHPRVLSQTQIGENESAVMYLGPDSLGLVQHFWKHECSQRDVGQILDVCTGCGIQGLYGLQQMNSNKDAHATLLDINPRALRFVLANAMLNGIELDKIKLVQADLQSNQGRQWHVHTDKEGNVSLTAGNEVPLIDLLDLPFDILTANPPFLPVPPSLASRHGAFSDGGGSGEEILQAIVELSGRVIRVKGTVAIVSEFFLASSNSASKLIERIQNWWTAGKNTTNMEGASGFLVTNEFPIDRESYATRRANDQDEYQVWLRHLEAIEMQYASPGFLFLRKDRHSHDIEHFTAPKSPNGSLWTPSNVDAVEYTAGLLDRLYKN